MQNQEADDLTNDEFRHFTPESRMAVDLPKLGFDFIHELFEAGDAYLEEPEQLRGKAKKKALFVSSCEAADEREHGRRKRPLHVTQPGL